MALRCASDTARFIGLCIKNEGAPHAAQSDLEGWLPASGFARNATSRLRPGHTTLTSKKCRAEIRVSTSSQRVANSVSAALAPDLKRLPKGDGSAEISLEGTIIIFRIETSDLPTLRASIHSFLMLSSAVLHCLTV